jgi:hypothetical protein
MSNLSELLPTGGGQNAVDFVATGTLASGQTVALKADGTVEAVSGVAQNIGASGEFESSIPTYVSSTFDSSQNKIVVAYRDTNNLNRGTAVVGTVSGETISFGTSAVFETGNTSWISVSYDASASKSVIAYSDDGNSNYGKTVVATVSGTSISFGSVTVFVSGYSYYIGSCYDSTNSKTIIGWRDVSNSNTGACVVGTVSGPSISFGTKATLSGSYTDGNKLAFDANAGKFVMSYYDPAASDHGKAVVGTVSGTSISFGSIATYETSEVRYPDIAYDSTAQKLILVCRGSNVGKAFVGSISGTSISFGATATFYATAANYNSVSYDATANKTIISFAAGSSSENGAFVVGTVSGTDISFTSSEIFRSGSTTTWHSNSFDSNANRLVFSYADGTGGGDANVIRLGSSNNTSFIGITSEAISNTATGAINTYGGINTAQTGLTIASDYYVQVDGSLSTTTSTVKAGQAVSATTINLMDLT